MNADDYERILNQRRRGGPRALGEPHPRARVPVSPVAAVVARAARDLRRHEEAVLAWERIAAPEWCHRARVDVVRGDVLVVVVADANLAFALRRQQAGLERRLRATAPGLRRLRLEVAGVPGGCEPERP